MDIYPTLLELCSLETNSKLDGISLVPLLKNPGSSRDHPSVMTYGRGNHAVRFGKWRYIRYADGTEELYDQHADPENWTNLADKPGFTPVIEQCQRWLPTEEAPAFADMKKKKANRAKPK